MAHSLQETTDLTCPSCAAEWSAPVWIILDAAERPDLKAALLADTLHEARCPACGAAGKVGAPLLYHDPARQQAVLAVPLSVGSKQAVRELAEQLHGLLADSYGDEQPPDYLASLELAPEIDGLRHLLRNAELPPDPLIEQLHAALEELIAAPDGDSFQRVLIKSRTLLMRPEADEALEEIIAQARAAGEHERSRKAVEQRALLSRFRTTLQSRRAALADALDGLAPLAEDELAVMPALRATLDAVDPQEVYAARLSLPVERHRALDGLLERLSERAAADEREDLLDFLRHVRALKEQ
ncbi:MAG TPA: CpXC domain-containing protein [Herpetosiphonaceae bacterium]